MGMDYINHWIPAFACLQQAGWNDNVGDRYDSLVFNVILASFIVAPFEPLPSFPFRPLRHSSESWNPGGGAGMVNRLQFLPACHNTAFIVIPAARECIK